MYITQDVGFKNNSAILLWQRGNIMHSIYTSVLAKGELPCHSISQIVRACTDKC